MRLKAIQDESQEGINMAPLIDCVFILLIFFLVTSLLQKPHRDRGIVLPEAKAPVETTAGFTTVIIEMTDAKPPRNTPQIFVDSEETTQMLLHRRLREVAQTGPDRRVRLDVDRNAPIADVVRMLDMLQFEGLVNVGVRTRD